MASMQNIIEFIAQHSNYAPWMAFGMIILAGFNIPFSIDVIMIVSAVLAATTIPEHTYTLYFSILIGAYFSAWIAYGVGRTLGRKLLRLRWFSKILHEQRLTRVGAFYDKHGFLTLLLGRFVPFGVRNCIFMTAGMSHSHFGKFAMRDVVACSVWTTVCFAAFYNLGLNYQILIERVKTINIIIFLAFSVTVIVLVWYKKRKKKQAS